MAQLVEHQTVDRRVAISSLTAGEVTVVSLSKSYLDPLVS